ncbi:MAG: hypothetical protein ACPGYV_01790 [Phycisphaeraceae bacterium]
MPEIYPDDATLLALSRDDATGVEYIPTGQSPYVVSYRRMVYRLLRSLERANDLRVYPVGGRLVGVRGGRCFVGDQPRDVAPVASIELNADATTHVYIDTAGAVVNSTTGLPTDRATYIPLAEATTDADAVTQLKDLRGEALLQAQTAALAGITATTDEINQALDGIGTSVTADNLSALTDGTLSTADSLHRHLASGQNVDGPATFSFINLSSDISATVDLAFSLPSALPDATRLGVDRSTGFLQQSYLGQSHHLVGACDLQWHHAGAFTTTQTGQLVGAVPIDGEVVAVILSCRNNIASSDGADGLAVDAFVNGSPITSASAELTAADGTGFRCTDQGDGTSGAIVSNGDQTVSRGDLITIDATYTANGTVSQQPTDAAVLVVIKAHRPL